MATKRNKRVKPKFSPYQRIILAANRGVGIRLSALEVASMSLDNAISSLADNDWEAQRRKNDERETGR